MPTGSFTVSATTYNFEVISDEAGEQATSDVSVQHIPGGDTSYVDLGGQQLVTRAMHLYFSTDVAFQNLKTFRGRQGTLVTTRDGTQTAVLQNLNRTHQNWDGVTEATASWLIVS